jgi:hypothetical protein
MTKNPQSRPAKRVPYDPSADPGIDLEGIYRPLRTSGAPFFGILHTRNAVDQWPINLDPDYQRGHVWDDLHRSRFVGHLLEGGHVPQCVINSGPGGDWPVAEMVDGKQRVTACLKWADGEIGAELSDGRMIHAAQLNRRSRRKCSMSIGLEYGMVRLSRVDALELYIRLNRGGVIHTDSEIDRVKALLEQEKKASR